MERKQSINDDACGRKPNYLKQIPAKPEGIYRSRLEAKFAAHWATDWPDHPAHYEPFRLQAFHGKGRAKGVACTYLPDFVIPSARIIVEVKPHPTLIDLHGMRQLLKAISASGWLFMSWGDRPKVFWDDRTPSDGLACFGPRDPVYDIEHQTNWSILGDGHIDQLSFHGSNYADASITRHPFGTSRDVSIEACGDCDAPSPKTWNTESWTLFGEHGGRRAAEWHEHGMHLLWGCFACGGKTLRGNGTEVLDLPRREQLRALYGVRDA